MIRLYIYLLISFLGFTGLQASDARQLLRQGNQLFNEGKYDEAEASYRQSLELEGDLFKAWFNLANALYRQGKMDEASSILENITREAPDDEALANTWHNLGNAYLGSGQIAESIDAFKQALRLSPHDDDTRYNLAYAQQLLQEMPPEEASGQDDQEKGEDEDEQQQSDEPAPGQDDQDQDQEPRSPEAEQAPDQRPDQISPEDARRILEALNRQEAAIQENMNRQDRNTEPVRTLRQW